MLMKLDGVTTVTYALYHIHIFADCIWHFMQPFAPLDDICNSKINCFRWLNVMLKISF